ncbi:MAG: Co2+/Mg2+ efflux protein ApaG [Planctomycetota bacterium]|jgi:ApaG protein
MPQSESVTRGIRVAVESRLHPERSRPSEDEWFFSYTIRISNEGSETARLLTRHWIITDANGRVDEVRGPGVVGQQPTLGPGESFEYTSFCPLGTSFGTMHGTYQMVTDSGESFDAEIAPFALGAPYSIN